MKIRNDGKFSKMKNEGFVKAEKGRVSRKRDEKFLTDGKCPDLKMEIVLDVEAERISKDANEMLLRYTRKFSSALERQSLFLSHLNLKRNNEIEEKEQVLETPNFRGTNEKPLPPEKYLRVDLCSPMGKQIWTKQSGLRYGTKTINIDALTSYCPKRISARNTKNSTKDSGNFVVTFKEPKAISRYKQGIQGQTIKNKGRN